jgi:Predicted transcriptional regulators
MFGDKLKEARKAMKLNQVELGNRLGVGNTTISNWEKGIAKPDIDTLEKICSTLTVSPNYFFKKLDSLAMTLKEQDLLKKYRELSSTGREMVDMVLDKEYERFANSNKAGVTLFPQAELSAAHERTDITITDDMREFDDDIMDGDDF